MRSRYPKEALVFEVVNHCGAPPSVGDVVVDAMLCECGTDCGVIMARLPLETMWFFYGWPDLRPLTPAARDFLANVKAGMR